MVEQWGTPTPWAIWTLRVFVALAAMLWLHFYSGNTLTQ